MIPTEQMLAGIPIEPWGWFWSILRCIPFLLLLLIPLLLLLGYALMPKPIADFTVAPESGPIEQSFTFSDASDYDGTGNDTKDATPWWYSSVQQWQIPEAAADLPQTTKEVKSKLPEKDRKVLLTATNRLLGIPFLTKSDVKSKDVPIKPIGPKYVLTVIGGTGTGSYSADEKVDIVAEEQGFTEWIGDAEIADSKNPKTSLKMPAKATTVTAKTTGQYLHVKPRGKIPMGETITAWATKPGEIDFGQQQRKVVAGEQDRIPWCFAKNGDYRVEWIPKDQNLNTESVLVSVRSGPPTKDPVASFEVVPNPTAKDIPVVAYDHSYIDVPNRKIVKREIMWDGNTWMPYDDQHRSHTFTVIGKYTVSMQVTDDQGKSVQAKVDVEVKENRVELPPIAKLVIDPNPAIQDKEVKAVDQSISGASKSPIIKREICWDNDNKYVPLDQKPTHQFTKEGEHPVSLKIIDENGKETIDKVTVKVVPPPPPPPPLLCMLCSPHAQHLLDPCSIANCTCGKGDVRVIVENGSGGGVYPYGAIVYPTATRRDINTPPEQFEKWIGEDVKYLNNPELAEPVLTIPPRDSNAKNIIITATYKDGPKEPMLTVVEGTGSGRYKPGTKVEVNAYNKLQQGMKFEEWSGDLSALGIKDADKKLPKITAEMSAKDARLIATFIPIYPPPPGIKLVVVGGAGTGTYPYSTSTTHSETTVTATIPLIPPAPIGTVFSEWIGDGAKFLLNPKATEACVRFPEKSTGINEITIAANFTVPVDPLYQLEVEEGTGDGNYKYGTRVPVTASPAKGRIFQQWGGPDVELIPEKERKNPQVTLVMPDKKACIRAEFNEPPGGSSITLTASLQKSNSQGQIPVICKINSTNVKSVDLVDWSVVGLKETNFPKVSEMEVLLPPKKDPYEIKAKVKYVDKTGAKQDVTVSASVTVSATPATPRTP